MNALRLLVLLLLPVVALASDPVPAARLPFGGTWEGIVGVSNGIPTRTTIFTNFTSSATIAQINNAISICPSNQVVSLAAGNYTLTDNLRIAKNGVTVQGATNSSGVPTTTLTFSIESISVLIKNTDWDSDAPAQYSNINVNSGLTRGSTAFVVASTPTGLTPGMMLVLSAPKNAPTIDGTAGDFSNWFGSSDQHLFDEIFEVTSVSGTTVNFWPPLNADYLSGTCKVHYRTFASQIIRSGIENMVLTNATGFFNNCGNSGADSIVGFFGADQCWAKNCFLYGIGSSCQPNACIKVYVSFNTEVRHNRFQNAQAFGASEYGIVLFHSSGALIEDNIFTTLPNAMPLITSSRTAFCYNIFTNEPYQSANFLSQIVFSHGSHDQFNLYEGNWIPTHYNDDTAGGNHTHSRNCLYFRERLLGWDGNGPKDSNCHCITFCPHHDNATVAGCVMGHAGTQTQYAQTSGSVGGVNSIFNYDSSVSGTTLTRKANYNTVNGGINSGEALAGGEALVNSYIHSSKPDWFGNLPWPWCDPGNFTQSDRSTNMPAGYRLAFSADVAAVGDTTAPTLVSATVSAAGTTINFLFNEAVMISAGGSGGFVVTMSGGPVTLTYSSGSGGTTLAYSTSRIIGIGETVTSGLNYTQPGSGVEDTSGNDLASFTGASVTNSSTQDITAPTLLSAIVGATGNTITFGFSETVTFGSGGSGSGTWALTMSGGVVNFTYVSGSGSSTLTYSTDRQILASETKSSGLNYTQPAGGNGIEDTAGNDLANLTGANVLNSSIAVPLVVPVSQLNKIQFSRTKFQ